jgi:hypothetical protein
MQMLGYACGPCSPSSPAPSQTAASAFHITMRFGTSVPESDKNLFNGAKARWEQIIIGDLPRVATKTLGVLPKSSECSFPINGFIDDIYICVFYKDIPYSGIIGFGGWEGARRANSIIPINGFVQLDPVEVLNYPRQLENIIRHEMGHALVRHGKIFQSEHSREALGTDHPYCQHLQGLGTVSEACPKTKQGSLAAAAYAELSGGCPASKIPMPSDCLHLKESCFGDEVMSEVVTKTKSLTSKITVSWLMDLGYTVNMTQAEPIVMNDSCKKPSCPSRRGLREIHPTRNDSDEAARKIAILVGREQLLEGQRQSRHLMLSTPEDAWELHDNHTDYQGAISVLYVCSTGICSTLVTL